MFQAQTQRSALLGVALLAALLAGCSSPPPEPAPTPPSPQPVETSTLVLVNHSGESVFRVRWRVSGEQAWSGDRLDTGDVIRPDEERRFELIPGDYELRLELGDGRNWSPSRLLTLPPGESLRCVLPGKAKVELGRLTLKNDSPWAIVGVRFSARTDPGWGPERLAKGEYVAAKDQRSWKVQPGHYQLQVSFQDGSPPPSAAYAVEAGEETVFRITGK